MQSWSRKKASDISNPTEREAARTADRISRSDRDRNEHHQDQPPPQSWRRPEREPSAKGLKKGLVATAAGGWGSRPRRRTDEYTVFFLLLATGRDCSDPLTAAVPPSVVTTGEARAGVSMGGDASLAAATAGLMGAAAGRRLTTPSVETRSAVPDGPLGGATDGLDAVSGIESLTGPGGAAASAASARARSPPCLGNSTMAAATPVTIPNAAAASATRTFC